MASGIDSTALTGVIDREEDWLANDTAVGIGQLLGERTDDIWVDPGEDRALLLTRRTSAVSVVDDGVTLAAADFHLIGGTRVEPAVSWTGPKVEVTYTPADEKAVEGVLLELVRLTLSASPFLSESEEGRSYTRSEDITAARDQLARSLHAHRGPMSARLGSGLVSDRVTS